MRYARIEVKDKKGVYDAVAEGLKRDIKDLGIKTVKDVEYIQVYTLQGNITTKKLHIIASEILADKVSQEYNYRGGFKPGKAALRQAQGKRTHVIEIAYNPGVMDPVEESTMKAIRDMGITGVTSVSTSKKYIIKGALESGQADKITQKLLYNKMIQHVVVHKEEKKKLKSYEFKPIEVDMINISDRKLQRMSIEKQLYLNLAEMKAIQEYFKGIGRNPTDCELETLAQTWSEHCKHKTMMGRVNYNGKIIGNLLKETVMKVT
ncbi:MAG: phosphoribosylformylglycinamidine synthase subunit PurS, partial [Candidatus Omnitrophota bacterium]